jgi:hypothetical protein
MVYNEINGGKPIRKETKTMAKQDNPNMALWDKYALPPTEALKAFDNGQFKGTDISPMWRIRCLTEEFGPCGFGWYSEIVEHWTETVGEVVMTFVNIRLYIKRGDEWSKPISATGGNKALRTKNGKPSDECYKMAYTDALGGACKLLGIGGAVYWERGYSKYEQDYIPDKQPEAPKEIYGTPIVEVPEYDWMKESEADIEYRALCLKAFSEDKLNTSCMRKFGTAFLKTKPEQLRKVMPEQMLKQMIDKGGNQNE